MNSDILVNIFILIHKSDENLMNFAIEILRRWRNLGISNFVRGNTGCKCISCRLCHLYICIHDRWSVNTHVDYSGWGGFRGLNRHGSRILKGRGSLEGSGGMLLPENFEKIESEIRYFYCQPTNAAWEALGLKTALRRHLKRLKLGGELFNKNHRRHPKRGVLPPLDPRRETGRGQIRKH